MELQVEAHGFSRQLNRGNARIEVENSDLFPRIASRFHVEGAAISTSQREEWSFKHVLQLHMRRIRDGDAVDLIAK